MIPYEDLIILPNQEECINSHCAMCGNLLWWVITKDSREYYYCIKCKVVKMYYE